MGNLLKEAFNEIHADSDLKQKTEQYVLNEAGKKTKIFRIRYLKVATAVCLSFLFFLAVGNWFYFTPTSEINIDINPSISLGINRLNDVVSVEGLNDDGLDLSNKLNLKYESYEDALSQLLSSEKIEELLAKGNKVVITVAGSNADQASQIVSQIDEHSSEYGNASCHHISSEEAEQAHELGLSYGKYQAYLQLMELDSSFTPEELQGMTMREIQDLIDKLSTGQTYQETEVGSNNGTDNSQKTNGSIDAGRDSDISQQQNGNGQHHGNNHESHHQ